MLFTYWGQFLSVTGAHSWIQILAQLKCMWSYVASPQYRNLRGTPQCWTLSVLVLPTFSQHIGYILSLRLFSQAIAFGSSVQRFDSRFFVCFFPQRTDCRRGLHMSFWMDSLPCSLTHSGTELSCTVLPLTTAWVANGNAALSVFLLIYSINRRRSNSTLFMRAEEAASDSWSSLKTSGQFMLWYSTHLINVTRQKWRNFNRKIRCSTLSCFVPGGFCYVVDIVIFCPVTWLGSVNVSMEIVWKHFTQSIHLECIMNILIILMMRP